jgi:hypothetical protein
MRQIFIIVAGRFIAAAVGFFIGVVIGLILLTAMILSGFTFGLEHLRPPVLIVASVGAITGFWAPNLVRRVLNSLAPFVRQF